MAHLFKKNTRTGLIWKEENPVWTMPIKLIKNVAFKSKILEND